MIDAFCRWFASGGWALLVVLCTLYALSALDGQRHKHYKATRYKATRYHDGWKM